MYGTAKVQEVSVVICMEDICKIGNLNMRLLANLNRCIKHNFDLLICHINNAYSSTACGKI